MQPFAIAFFVFGFSQQNVDVDRFVISGRVVDSVTRLPLEGAAIALVPRPQSQANADEVLASLTATPMEGVRSARSDTNGRFSIEVDAAGHYSAFVRREGYVDWGDRGTDRTFEIKPGVKPAELLVELLEPLSVAGRIEDRETSAPLRGFRVLPMRWQVKDGAMIPMIGGRGAVTDASGRFELRGLPAGSYLLRLLPPETAKFADSLKDVPFRGRGPLAYLDGYYPDVRDVAEASPLAVQGAGVEGLSIRLARRPSAGVRTCLSATSGQTRIVVSRVESSSAYRMSAGGAAGTVPGDGCYQVEGLAPGRYFIHATQGRRAAYAEVRLDDSRVDGIELNLQDGVLVEGRLRLDPDVARIWPEGATLRVRLAPLGRPVLSIEEVAAVPVEGPDLSFRKDNVMGAFRVAVFGLPAGFSVGRYLYNGAVSRQPVVRLSAAASKHVLELVVEPATGSVDVTVVGGKRAAGSQVVLLPEDHEAEEPDRQALVRTADPEGHAVFNGLLAGRYRAFVFPGGSAWRTDSNFGSQSMAGLPVEVRTAAKVAVELKVSSEHALGSGWAATP